MPLLKMSSIFGVPFISRKNHGRYNVSRSDFYEGENYLANQSRLLNLTNNLRNNNEINTEKNIKFYGVNFGESVKSVLRHLGKPNYISRKKSVLKNHKILFYRIMLKNVKCILQFHFLDDQFFLGVIEVKNNQEHVQKEISNLVREKYAISNTDWVGTIKDNSDNTIDIQEGMIQRMTYLSGDSVLRSEIRAQVNRIIEIKEKHGQLNLDMILKLI